MKWETPKEVNTELLNKTAEVEYNLDTLGIQLKGQKKFTTTQVTNFSSPAMAELEVLFFLP